MDPAAALRSAIELLHIPSRVRSLRENALPGGVENLLRIAAGDEQTIVEAAEHTGRRREVVVEAAEFFIEQILLSDTDSYRALGANIGATTNELRRNMALLMTWLHPDRNPKPHRAVLARKVITAWASLNTPQKRAAYDLALQATMRGPVRVSSKRSAKISSLHNLNGGLSSSQRLSRRIASGEMQAPGLLRRAFAIFVRARR